MEKPVVSVIVPIYKTEKYLKQCVDTILSQTLQNIEIILVDDGSPDNCPAICDAYAKQDGRIKVIHQQNGGYGRACNAGISFASGEYIGFVESDDNIEFDMFETLYSVAQDSGSTIVKGSFFHEYHDGTSSICSLSHITKNQKIYTLQAKDDIYLMLYESSIWSAIYKRDFIMSNKILMFETKGASYQDVIWKFQTYAIADSITLIDKPVYRYRVMTSGSSSKSSKNYNAMFVNYEEIKRFLLLNKKFDEHRKSFYLHQFFDSHFHLKRLDGIGRKKFTKKMRQVIAAAKRGNITIESFHDFHIPNDIREVYYQIASNKVPYKVLMRHKIKQILLAFYWTRTGTAIWNCSKKIANSKYVKKILARMLEYDDRLDIPEKHIMLDHIYFPSKKKNALIIMPSWGVSAACMYVRQICETLRSNGYNLHLIIYSSVNTAPSDSFWEHTYTIRPISSNYGLSHPFGRDNANRDANLIDDWVGDDLLAFVKVLDKNCHFELCFCNYVFLSKVLTCFNNTTKKIIVTHDIFSNRNERLLENRTKSLYFGTSPKEEKAGLDRADYILAIQEKERLFFKNLTDKPVITLPYVPIKKYRSYSFGKLPIKIGYIASDNPPNITSIKEYIKLLQNEKDLAIYIAGSISFVLEQNLPNVSLLGIVDDLDDFYSRYDLYINPDVFESGLKIKTVEALSYGCSIICTKEASVGIDVTKKYYKAESIEELVEITKECVINPALLTEMAEESKNVYDKFYNTYSADVILDKIIN